MYLYTQLLYVPGFVFDQLVSMVVALAVIPSTVLMVIAYQTILSVILKRTVLMDMMKTVLKVLYTLLTDWNSLPHPPDISLSLSVSHSFTFFTDTLNEDSWVKFVILLAIVVFCCITTMSTMVLMEFNKKQKSLRVEMKWEQSRVMRSSR